MEISDYLRMLRAHWVGALGLFLAGVIFAAAWSYTQPRLYTAESTGFVAASEVSDIGSSMTGNSLAQAKIKSYVDIGSWRSVAEYAIEQLGLQTTPERLVNQVQVTNPTGTVILNVSATDTTPEGARDLAEIWIRGIIQQVEMIEKAAGGVSAVTIVPGDSARLPDAPSSPNWRLNLALGALIGLLLGAGYAILRDRMDRYIRTASQVEQVTGLAVVGTLPLESELKSDPQIALNEIGTGTGKAIGLAESFRVLRTNLQYMSVDDPPRAIVVTSPLPGDGKSTTAAGLALSIAAAGQKVVLVDADLRRPRIAEYFSIPEGAGLTEVLAGRAALDDVLVPVGDNDNLKVLAAGSIPPNPSEILGSERMRHLIDTLGEDGLVILDTPPLLPVTDSAVLTTRADGALIVTGVGKTTYEVLEHALNLLTKAKGRALGIVLNRMPVNGSRSGYGGYYTGDYYTSTEPEPEVQSKRARRLARR